MQALVHDLRYAFRSILKQPGYAAVVCATLALGIGANTAIFSVVHGVLLEPLPYTDPQDLVAVWGRFDPESGFDFPQFSLSTPEYLDYRAQSRTMEDVAAYRNGRLTVTETGKEPERVAAGVVTANMFKLLRADPVLGRTFTDEETLPGAEKVVVLHYGYWQTRFGGDPDAVGKSLVANGEPRQIVGVMPPGFDFPNPEVRMWTPLTIDPANPGNRQSHSIRAIARLAPGSTLEQADSEMRTLMAAWKAEYPDIHTGHYLFLRPLLDDVTGTVRPALLLLLGAAGFTLLIVCANVASVVLARGEGRMREVAIRTALGARRARVVQLLLGESLLLSIAGAAAGVALAHFGVRALVRLNAGSIPRAESLGIDASVLGFALAVTLLTAALFGLFPALQAAAADVQGHLRESGRGASAGPGRLGLRRGLVVVEVAVSFLLVVGAGLMTKSFSRLLHVDPGFDSSETLVAAVSLPSKEYDEPDKVLGFYRRLLEATSALPGVTSASASSALPLYESPGVWDFEIEGRPTPAAGEMAWNAAFSVVRPGFFKTMGVALASGRYFSDADTADSLPVTVINETLARRFFPGEDPVGRRIRVAGGTYPWMTIVGVVEDIRYERLADEARPAYYSVHDQSPVTIDEAVRAMYLVARVSGEPMSVAGALRSAVKELDPNLPVTALQTMDDVVLTSLARPRFTTVLLGLFAAVALLLGGTGIYGVLTYSFVLRRQEIGIRKALGARPGQLAAMVVRQGMALVAGGLALGGIACYGSLRVLSSLLYGVSLADVSTFTSVALVLVGVALAASGLPMARVIRLDPLAVLRAE